MADYGIYLVSVRGEPIGEWLTFYDPDGGDGEYPTGDIGHSPDSAGALRFPNKVTAMACVFRRAATVPTRPDGKPNRPLSAFTLVIEELPDA